MLKVITSNIRFDNPNDKEHAWPKRKNLLAECLSLNTPDILGTQEGREPQIRNLNSLLPNLSLVDQHREWIKERMYPCLFYNPKSIKVLESGDIWLSETPHIPGSKSFESTFPRLCTWVIARFLKSNLHFLAINCHLDHVQQNTRVSQIKVLCYEIQKINHQKYPILLMGDFNDAPNSITRNTLISNLFDLKDPWETLNQKEESSFHKFQGHLSQEKGGSRIDWILAHKEFIPQSISLIKECRDSLYPSDHFPVLATFKF